LKAVVSRIRGKAFWIVDLMLVRIFSENFRSQHESSLRTVGWLSGAENFLDFA
jgi:hypothetical protein